MDDSRTNSAGWYIDALGDLRWWNGTAWTEHVSLEPLPSQSVDNAPVSDDIHTVNGQAQLFASVPANESMFEKAAREGDPFIRAISGGPSRTKASRTALIIAWVNLVGWIPVLALSVIIWVVTVPMVGGSSLDNENVAFVGSAISWLPVITFIIMLIVSVSIWVFYLQKKVGGMHLFLVNMIATLISLFSILPVIQIIT